MKFLFALILHGVVQVPQKDIPHTNSKLPEDMWRPPKLMAQTKKCDGGRSI